MLAVARFASVRSANTAARVAEHALPVGLRPLPLPSGIDDEVHKVRIGDGRSMRLNRGRAVAEVDGGCRAPGDLAAQRGHRLGAIRDAGDPDHAALYSAIVPGAHRHRPALRRPRTAID